MAPVGVFDFRALLEGPATSKEAVSGDGMETSIAWRIRWEHDKNAMGLSHFFENKDVINDKRFTGLDKVYKRNLVGQSFIEEKITNKMVKRWVSPSKMTEHGDITNNIF